MSPPAIDVPPPFLACPECRSAELDPASDLEPAAPPFDARTGVRCRGCRRGYPRVNGVWVLWSDALKRLELGKPPADADLADQVKWANITIYEETSEQYGEHHDGSRSYTETLLFLKALADDFQSPPPPGHERVIVDVGCAAGIGMHLGVRGYRHVVGVDISLANLEAVHRLGYCAVLADADSLPFRRGGVDLVTCFAVLHHLPHPDAFMASAHECLRPGGVLIAGCEPSRAAMGHRLLGRIVYDGRKPVYRVLSRFSSRFYHHQSEEQQTLNDLAEISRTHGGFAPEALARMLDGAPALRDAAIQDVPAQGALVPEPVLVLELGQPDRHGPQGRGGGRRHAMSKLEQKFKRFWDDKTIPLHRFKGVDLSASMLEVFARKHPGVATECAGGHSYRDDGEYDLIFSNGVIQCFDRAMLAEHLAGSRAMLAPGGLIVGASILWRRLRWASAYGDLSGRPQSRQGYGWAAARYLRRMVIDDDQWYDLADFDRLAAEAGLTAEYFGSMHYMYRFHVVLRRRS
jgi:SAM-dependent methyltransferase